jgi:hypothetical protein
VNREAPKIFNVKQESVTMFDIEKAPFTKSPLRLKALLIMRYKKILIFVINLRGDL